MRLVARAVRDIDTHVLAVHQVRARDVAILRHHEREQLIPRDVAVAVAVDLHEEVAELRLHLRTDEAREGRHELVERQVLACRALDAVLLEGLLGLDEVVQVEVQQLLRTVLLGARPVRLVLRQIARDERVCILLDHRVRAHK